MWAQAICPACRQETMHVQVLCLGVLAVKRGWGTDKGWILLTSGLHLCWWPDAGFTYTLLCTLGTGGFFIPISTSLSKENLLIALCFPVLVGSCRQTHARILLSINSCHSHSPSPDFPSVSPCPDIPRLNISVIILYNVIYKRKLLGFQVALHMWNRDESSRMAVSSEDA